MYLLALLLCSLAALSAAQDGYTGYNLKVTDPTHDSTIFQTRSTDTSNGTILSGPPDVFLDASVAVGSIDILVQNLSAKISLDAQVLSLLDFSAGVTLSVDKVDLSIQNVNAQVHLEARLDNLVAMIDDVLNSVDLNPVIATLGGAVGEVGGAVGQAVGGLGSTVGGVVSNLTQRDVGLDNVLFSVNDYQGNTHTNRVLQQNGNVVDQKLDNDGKVGSESIVGSYQTLFKETGEVLELNNMLEKEYLYAPYAGLSVIALLGFDASGDVVSARVLSEFNAGGTSSIAN